MDLNLPRVAGEPGFEMHFGATGLIPEDDSFRGGYTYLKNPLAPIIGDRLRNDLYELSDVVFGQDDLRICDMAEPLSSERGDGHTLFLTPGDPRPRWSP